MAPAKNFLVTGATGVQGGAVIARLLQTQTAPSSDPFTVFAISRNPDSPSAQNLTRRGITVLNGDLTDEPSLTEILSSNSIASVFLVTDPYGKGGVDAELMQGKALIRAAQNSAVKHVVFTSAEGAQRDSGVAHFDSKFEIERLLKSSGMDYTILRPVAFMENLPVESGFKRFMLLGVFHALLLSKPLQLISVKDIAWFAVEALTRPAVYGGEEINLAGDELDVQQIVRAYEKVEGRRVWKAWLPNWIIWLLPSEARKYFMWITSIGNIVDVPKLRKRHPSVLRFEDYLRLTGQARDGTK